MKANRTPARVEIMRLPGGAELALPAPATEQSAGVDLVAALDDPLTIEAGGRAMVPTGIAIALPANAEAQVRPRSGLAWKHGITVLNSPGTIDADYRGEIKVILINLGQQPFVIERGMRIAQLVVSAIHPVQWATVETLPDSDRGEGGFGSTGSHAATTENKGEPQT